MIKFIVMVAAVLNLVCFGLYGIDKGRAKRGSRRISEKTLLWWSVLAPFGAVVGTKFFHHKTRKLKFDIVLFVSCIVHILVIGTALNILV